MTLLQLQNRGKIMVHGSKGSDVVAPDASYADFLKRKNALPGGGGETPQITFVPHREPQPIGTDVCRTE